MIRWRHLFGTRGFPFFPNLRQGREDTLFFDSLTRGTLIAGNPGVGKTTWAAMELVRYALAYPHRPIFCFDASESVTNEFVEIYHLLPPEQFELIDRRVVFDRPGDEKWVIPKPFFHDSYGLSDEDQVQKATSVIEETNPEKVKLTPIMGISITETSPNLFRLLQVIKNERGESWQITEAKKLLQGYEEGGLLEMVCKRFGRLAPEAKWYFEKDYLSSAISPRERELRTYALRSALGVVESKPLRARYGCGRPGITTKEIVDGGLIYLLSGAALNNQPKAQAWVFWDEYASLKGLINKRIPHDAGDEPVLLVMDEVYQLFKIAGMAREIGQLAAYYRSRKLQLIMIIQALWQLDEKLAEQIWNLGNQVVFAMDNFNDAYKLAQQLFEYDPRSERLPPRTPTGQPIVESDRGQYLTAANWIQNLKWRQMIMRRYLDEREKEAHVQFIERSRERPVGNLPAPLEEIKETLFRRRAIRVEEALKEINQRKFTYKKDQQRPTI